MYIPGSSSAAVCGHAWVVSIVDEVAAMIIVVIVTATANHKLISFYEQTRNFLVWIIKYTPKEADTYL